MYLKMHIFVYDFVSYIGSLSYPSLFISLPYGIPPLQMEKIRNLREDRIFILKLLTVTKMDSSRTWDPR